MEPPSAINASTVQTERLAPAAGSEPTLDFHEAILSIDPHHGIDTTYRKLFVGGLAWQVRAAAPHAATPPPLLNGSFLTPLGTPAPPARRHTRAAAAARGTANAHSGADFDPLPMLACVRADELREPAAAFFRLRGESPPPAVAARRRLGRFARRRARALLRRCDPVPAAAAAAGGRVSRRG